MATLHFSWQGSQKVYLIMLSLDIKMVSCKWIGTLLLTTLYCPEFTTQCFPCVVFNIWYNELEMLLFTLYVISLEICKEPSWNPKHTSIVHIQQLYQFQQPRWLVQTIFQQKNWPYCWHFWWDSNKLWGKHMKFT
jgi:hypothetical protein